MYLRKIFGPLFVVASTLAAVQHKSFEHRMLDNLGYMSAPPGAFDALRKTADTSLPFADKCLLITNQANSVRPLFSYYPELVHYIPHISLGNLPTPVMRCEKLGAALNVSQLYMKRDDLTGLDGQFGGNKVRKLEFLLADALESFKEIDPQLRTVMTFGAAGSNHALATAIYAKKLGLGCVSMLRDQWNNRVVRRNLLLHYATDAKLNWFASVEDRAHGIVEELAACKAKIGSYPYIIPTGGSCPVGVLGYVNAAFELKDQIAAGLLPEPDRIYVPLPVGSGGTFSGLVLGARAAGLKSRVIGVLIEPATDVELVDWRARVVALITGTNDLLIQSEPHFPRVGIAPESLEILTGYSGGDYALYTQEAVDAIRLMREQENVQLDGVYSGKAFSGLVGDVRKNKPQNEVILFWDTFCSNTFEQEIAKIDYKLLPQAFHKYFEEDVQPLDH